MVKKFSNTMFWSRLAAFIIDALVIYGTTYLIVTLATLIPVYIPPLECFIILSLLYNIILYLIIGNTLGKILSGIKIERYDKKKVLLLNIVMREIFGKIIIGLLLPIIFSRIYLLNFWFWDIQAIVVFQAILFFLFIITKRTWYDIIGQTIVVKDTRQNNIQIRYSFIYVVFICIFFIGIKLTSIGNMNNYIPTNNQHVLKPYKEFIQEDKLNAKEYILNLFNKYDIVILCERAHPETTQWDLIFELVSDSSFIQKGGNIFTEYGSISLQVLLDDMMNSPDLSEEEVDKRIIHIMRDFGIWGHWSNSNFYKYLKKLYALNKILPDSSKINHYFSDIPIDWENMTPTKYDSINTNVISKRDKIMADNIIDKYKEFVNNNRKRKKSLVIMNSRHAFRLGKINSKIVRENNTAAYIFQTFPNITANVLINTSRFNWNSNRLPIRNGVWDQVFNELDNPMIGFDFENSPFGNDNFDLFPFRNRHSLKYKDVFNGFVFYKQLKEHHFERGIPGFFDSFIPTLIHREHCITNESYKVIKENLHDYKRDKLVVEGLEYYARTDNLVNIIIMSIFFIIGFPVSFFMFRKTYNKS